MDIVKKQSDLEVDRYQLSGDELEPIPEPEPFDLSIFSRIQAKHPERDLDMILQHYLTYA